MKSHPRSIARKLLVAAVLAGSTFGAASVGFAQSVKENAGSKELIKAVNVRETAVPQSVYLTADKSLVGQVQILGSSLVRAAGSLNLSLLSSDGKTMDATTDEQGNFAVQNIEPGVYSIFGRSGNVVVCQSIRVFENEKGSGSQLFMFAVSPTSAEIDKLIATSYTSSVPNSDESILPGPPTSYSATEGRVAIDRDGVLKGSFWSIRGDVKGTEVVIYQNGNSVARTLADVNGKFSVKLAPGSYSMIASGTGGIAAVGFKAVSPSTSVSRARNDSNVRLVALQSDPCAAVLDVGLAPCPGFSTAPAGEIVEVVPSSGAVGSPTMAGGYGGGSFGGGSMGGGGGGGAAGGAGKFLGLAGLGAGIAGLAVGLSNNDDAAVVSPSGQ
jgi:hypothetical protein